MATINYSAKWPYQCDDGRLEGRRDIVRESFRELLYVKRERIIDVVGCVSLDGDTLVSVWRLYGIFAMGEWQPLVAVVVKQRWFSVVQDAWRT